MDEEYKNEIKKPNNWRRNLVTLMACVAIGATIVATAPNIVDKIGAQIEENKQHYFKDFGTIELQVGPRQGVWAVLKEAIEDGEVTIGDNVDFKDMVDYTEDLNKEVISEDGVVPLGENLTVLKRYEKN